MARVDYRSASYEIWQAMAAGWDRERRWMWDVSRAVSEQMLEASRSIGPDGRLICTDFAPEMVGCAGALKISMGTGATSPELAGGIAMALQAMPQTERETVRRLVERTTGDYRVDGALVLPSVALNASAV